MAGVAGEEFRDGAEAVEVGCDSGADDGGSFTTAKRHGCGKQPSGKKVRYGAHGQRTICVFQLAPAAKDLTAA